MQELKLKYFCSAHRKHPTQDCSGNSGRKELTHPLCRPDKTRKYLQQLIPFFTLPPHPFSLFYKRNWHPNPGKMVLWDTSPSSSGSAGFLNKVNIPYPNNFSLNLLACSVVSSMTIDLIIVLPSSPHLNLILANEHFFNFSNISHDIKSHQNVKNLKI